MIRLAIVGGRDFDKPSLMFTNVHRYYDFKNIIIVTGDAKGADDHAIKLAKRFDIEYQEHEALWDKYGKDAGFIRNADIEEESAECLAFWDGKSSGTKHTIDLFKEAKKLVRIVRY